MSDTRTGPAAPATGSMTMTAVIPTRNRPHDLGKAVESILAQVRPPDELIIVDQSPGDESSQSVHALFRGVSFPKLVYIHDTAVTGLVDAKRVGSDIATGDIVCFLEDDVVLEPEYIAQIENGFARQPDMCGCSGVMTNPPYTSPFYIAVRRLFFRGIFHDPRVSLTARALRGGDELIPCDILSGGISCWRREIFDRVRFDTANGFFLFEDMEFATRVVRAVGHHLYINPRARLEHHGSPVNRDVHGVRQKRKMIEALVFFKKRRDWPGAWTGLASGMVWWFGEAVLQGVRLRSVGPLAGYLSGVRDGLRRPVVDHTATQS